MFSYFKSFFAEEESAGPTEEVDLFEAPQDSFKIVNILTDLKFNLMSLLLAKTVFEKYFSDFERTKTQLLCVVLEARGMPLELYKQLLDTCKGSLSVEKLLLEIDDLK